MQLRWRFWPLVVTAFGTLLAFFLDVVTPLQVMRFVIDQVLPHLLLIASLFVVAHMSINVFPDNIRKRQSRRREELIDLISTAARPYFPGKLPWNIANFPSRLDEIWVESNVVVAGLSRRGWIPPALRDEPVLGRYLTELKYIVEHQGTGAAKKWAKSGWQKQSYWPGGSPID